jgi:hypothetical protein
VQFTCEGQDIPSLFWFLQNDETREVQYIHKHGDEDRLPFQVAYDGDFGPILITNVTTSQDVDQINVTSTFTTNTSVLEDFTSIHCGTRAEVKSNLMMVNISVLGKCTCMWR